MRNYFNKATERKILPERMPFETVVGQNATEIGMICEKHPVHIPNFALIPNFNHKFIFVTLHPNPSIETQGKQIVDQLKKEQICQYFLITTNG